MRVDDSRSDVVEPEVVVAMALGGRFWRRVVQQWLNGWCSAPSGDDDVRAGSNEGNTNEGEDGLTRCWVGKMFADSSQVDGSYLQAFWREDELELATVAKIYAWRCLMVRRMSRLSGPGLREQRKKNSRRTPLYPRSFSSLAFSC